MIEVNQELIRIITSRLVESYHPISIYLFGSYAWGVPNRESDLDFLVVLENTDLDKAERMRIGLRELIDLNVDVDLLVYTKKEIDNQIVYPSSLPSKVFKDGVKLYEAA